MNSIFRLKIEFIPFDKNEVLPFPLHFWATIDKSTTTKISDLINKIKLTTNKQDSIINLFYDNFFLPPEETIFLIKDESLIKAIEIISSPIKKNNIKIQTSHTSLDAVNLTLAGNISIKGKRKLETTNTESNSKKRKHKKHCEKESDDFLKQIELIHSNDMGYPCEFLNSHSYQSNKGPSVESQKDSSVISFLPELAQNDNESTCPLSTLSPLYDHKCAKKKKKKPCFTLNEPLENQQESSVNSCLPELVQNHNESAFPLSNSSLLYDLKSAKKKRKSCSIINELPDVHESNKIRETKLKENIICSPVEKLTKEQKKCTTPDNENTLLKGEPLKTKISQKQENQSLSQLSNLIISTESMNQGIVKGVLEQEEPKVGKTNLTCPRACENITFKTGETRDISLNENNALECKGSHERDQSVQHSKKKRHRRRKRTKPSREPRPFIIHDILQREKALEVPPSSNPKMVKVRSRNTHIVFDDEENLHFTENKVESGRNSLPNSFLQENLESSLKEGKLEKSTSPKNESTNGQTGQMDLSLCNGESLKEVGNTKEQEPLIIDIDAISKPKSLLKVEKVQNPNNLSQNLFINYKPDSVIIFKILELSEDYCPKVSDYKEGKVIKYNQKLNEITLQVTKGTMNSHKHLQDKDGNYTLGCSHLIDPKIA